MKSSFSLPPYVYLRREKTFNLLEDKKNKERYILNDTASHILTLYRKGFSQKDVIEILSSFYGVDKNTIINDVKNFTARMLKKKLLRPGQRRTHLTKEDGLRLLINEDRKIKNSNVDWFLKSPLYVSFYPTFKCNQNCIFCFVPLTYRNSMDANVMSFDKAKEVADQLIKSDVHEIQILGGEPFMVPWIFRFISYCEKKELFVLIITNGSFLEPRHIKLIPTSPRVFIEVSVHGLKDTHDYLTRTNGAFDKLERNVRKMVEKNLNLSLTTVVLNKNINEIEDMVLYFTEIGVKSFGFLYPYAIGGARKLREYPTVQRYWNLLERLKKRFGNKVNLYGIGGFNFLRYSKAPPSRSDIVRWLGALFCKAGTTKLDILPNGDIVPCFPMNMKIGNIFQKSLSEIWSSPLLNIFRYMTIPEECQGCKFAHTCRGGCPIYRIERGGLFTADDRCPRIGGV